MQHATRLFVFTLMALSSARALPADPLPVSSGFGLDGMAPAGHWATRLTLLNNGYTQKFDNSGRSVDFDTGVDGIALNSAILPALAPLGAGAHWATSPSTQASTPVMPS